MKDGDLIDALSRIIPGEVPLGVFNEIARLTVTPVVELIVESEDGILLKKRRGDDLYWPGQYCLPGRIISSKSKYGIEKQVESLCDDLGIDANSRTGVKFITIIYLETNRGMELVLVYAISTLKRSDDIDYEFLPKNKIYNLRNIIPEHKRIIRIFNNDGELL